MKYDGSIYINTKISTDGANSQMSSLENRIVKTSDRLEDLKKRQKELAEQKIPTKEYADLEKKVEKAAKSLATLQAKAQELESAKTPTEDYKYWTAELAKAKEMYNKLIDKQIKMQELGADPSSKAWKSLSYDIDTARKKVNDYSAIVQDLEKSGDTETHTKEWERISAKIEQAKQELESYKSQQADLAANNLQFIDPTATAEYSRLDAQIRQTSSDLDVLKLKHEELRQKQEEVSKGSSSVGSALGKLGKRIAGLAKRIFIFSLITKAFRAMVSGIQEGLKNYVQYSAEYNKTMSDFSSSAATLKNSMATAAAPILNLFVPALTTLCGWLTTAANLISKFAAFVSGKSTWTRAVKQQKNYAKSLQNTSKAADKAKTSLAGFDDLDVLQQDTGSTGGAGGGGEITGAGAFEEVPFTDADISLLEKVKAILEAILPLVVLIGAAFLAWKLTDFLTKLMAVNPILGKILSILFIIAGAALAIYSYLHMWNNGVDWKGLIGYIVGVSLVFAGLYTLFGPAVAGIALIVAGIAGLVLAFKDIYENGLNVQNISLLLVSVFGLIVGVFLVFGGAAAVVVGAIAILASLFVVALARAGKLQEAVGFLKDAFAALSKFVKDIFAGDFKSALHDLCVFAINIVNAIITAFESLINFIIDGINAIIKAAVDLANKIPGFDFDAPQIPHVTFGRLEIPALANGGITSGATLAKIGEAGREAVLPLENNLGYLDEFANRIADKIPAAQTGPVYLQVDGKTFARLMHPYSEAENNRVGLSFTK